MASVTFTSGGQHTDGTSWRLGWLIGTVATALGAAAVVGFGIGGSAALTRLAGAIVPSLVAAADQPEAVSLVRASQPLMLAIRHAHELEAHGIFGDAAQHAWHEATEECRRFSLQPIATSQGGLIRLWMLEAEEDRAQEIAALLENMLPGRRDALQAGNGGEEVTWSMVAATAPEGVRERAINLALLHREAIDTAHIIRHYRDIVNYDVWKATCEAEESTFALQAREALWHADRDAELGRLEQAKGQYEAGFAAMREVLDASPVLEHDEMTTEAIREIVGRYRQVLSELHEGFPQDFVLGELAEAGSRPLAGGL
jgi:hypothetical protein